MEHQMTPFEGIKIRKLEHNGVWFFSVIDIIGHLTESPDPKNYWSKLKERDPQTLTVCQSFKMPARKRYEQTSGEQVVSEDNFLAQIEEAKTQNNLLENQD